MLTDLQIQHEAAHVVAFAYFTEATTVRLTRNQRHAVPDYGANEIASTLEHAQVLYSGYVRSVRICGSWDLIKCVQIAKRDFEAIDNLHLNRKDAQIMIDNTEYLIDTYADVIEKVAVLIAQGCDNFHLDRIRQAF